TVKCFRAFADTKLFYRFCCEAVQSLSEFEDALRVVQQYGLVSADDLHWLQSTALPRLQEESRSIETEEEAFDELPEFATCPILKDMLKDPVALPADAMSASDPTQLNTQALIVCNRAAIEHHLLSESTNPFTRVPLTMEALNAFNKREDIAAFIA